MLSYGFVTMKLRKQKPPLPKFSFCLHLNIALINAASSLLTGSSPFPLFVCTAKSADIPMHYCFHPWSRIPRSPLALHVRLIQLLQQNPEQFRLGRVERVKGTIVSKEYFFPKRFVTIRSRDIKRELTEEQRKEIAERLKKLS